MALPHLRANIVLLIGVTIGFVHGVMAATTPTGFAILVIPVVSSVSRMPRDFLPLRLFHTIFDFCLFFAILSGTLPMPVSSTAISARYSALSYTTLPTALTAASTSFCDIFSKTAWAFLALSIYPSI